MSLLESSPRAPQLGSVWSHRKIARLSNGKITKVDDEYVTITFPDGTWTSDSIPSFYEDFVAVDS